MTKEQLASLAHSLKDNEAFQQALNDQRSGALDALATIRADDILGIQEHQATVRVVDGIRANLDQFISNGAPPKAIGIA